MTAKENPEGAVKLTSTISIIRADNDPAEIQNVENVVVEDGILYVVSRGELWTERHAFARGEWLTFHWVFVEDQNGGPILSPIETGHEIDAR